jgi:hypothetical protein
MDGRRDIGEMVMNITEQLAEALIDARAAIRQTHIHTDALDIINAALASYEASKATPEVKPEHIISFVENILCVIWPTPEATIDRALKEIHDYWAEERRRG